MDEKTLEKINAISSRLESHLQVAEFVDKNSGEEIRRLFKQFHELTKRVNATETDIILLKNNNNAKKENFYSLLKVITLICVVIGAIFTLIKMGILNGVGIN